MRSKAVQLSDAIATSILEMMPQGLIILDASLCVIGSNEASGQLFGFSKHDDFVGKPLSQFYANPDELENFIALLFKHKTLKHSENRFVTIEGKPFIGAYSGLVMEDTEVNSFTITIFIRDITASSQGLEKLRLGCARNEKIAKDFDHLMYIITHDLTAPLRAINNLSQWIQEDVGPSCSEDSTRNFQLLTSRVARMESMVKGISEYAKISKENYKDEPVDVFILLSDLLNKLSVSAQVQIEDTRHTPRLTTSKTALQKVFSNLIDNAIAFNDKNEVSVHVHSRDIGEYIEFTVQDNGPGIPAEFHKKIFLIFQTLHSKDTLQTTGMGLTIVKRILDEYDGKIRIESEIGVGSRFIFTWPKN
jgi:PAS domain S-box-containing protein